MLPITRNAGQPVQGLSRQRRGRRPRGSPTTEPPQILIQIGGLEAFDTAVELLIQAGARIVGGRLLEVEPPLTASQIEAVRALDGYEDGAVRVTVEPASADVDVWRADPATPEPETGYDPHTCPHTWWTWQQGGRQARGPAAALPVAAGPPAAATVLAGLLGSVRVPMYQLDRPGQHVVRHPARLAHPGQAEVRRAGDQARQDVALQLGRASCLRPPAWVKQSRNPVRASRSTSRETIGANGNIPASLSFSSLASAGTSSADRAGSPGGVVVQADRAGVARGGGVRERRRRPPGPARHRCRTADRDTRGARAEPMPLTCAVRVFRCR